MDIQPTEDHLLLLDSVRKLLDRLPPEPFDGRRCFYSPGHDAALEASGLMDAARIEEYGPLAGALLVEEVARAPIVVEAGASSLIRPLLCPDWPRPLAVLAGDHRDAVRFLPQAKSALFLSGGKARIVRIAADEVEDVSGFFTYPMGRLVDAEACLARAEPVAEAPECARLLRVALACEFVGALQGALDAVVAHVKTRHQFGRPLGSFQALQHRLAQNAASVAALRLLTHKAAVLGGAAEAFAALGYAQETASRALYDLHQFMGAMGLTLEHALYRWSYRLKLLGSEFGGASRQYRDLAGDVWGTNADGRTP